MQRTAPALIFVALQALFCLGSRPVEGKSDDLYLTSTSIAGARKLGRLVRVVKVEPLEFAWEEHRVTVTESWLEHLSPNENQLRFKFLIDGKRYAEARIRDRGKNLVFRREDTKPESPIDYFVTRRLWENVIGGTHGEVVHSMRLSVDDVGPIKLGVGTYYTHRGRPASHEKNWSATVLTFYVSEKV